MNTEDQKNNGNWLFDLKNELVFQYKFHWKTHKVKVEVAKIDSYRLLSLVRGGRLKIKFVMYQGAIKVAVPVRFSVESLFMREFLDLKDSGYQWSSGDRHFHDCLMGVNSFCKKFGVDVGEVESLLDNKITFIK